MLGHTALADDIALLLGRNIAAYVGLALIMPPFPGHRAASVCPAAVPVVCAATGWTASGRPQPWAWILQPAGSPAGAALAAVTLITGLLVGLRHPVRPAAGNT
ncbi:hypothetical protein IHE55_00760 [Streptomyces pactum]|uniref:HPP family protein n=1 Tax=Streptomyces pactum TaxID=68249 RepID=A0ABS0NE28_9ACTN|nr:hypothetical protein [Streptomyces pactum]MBH5333408.1 hypothetical protein [Streptomyces pactum]